MSFDRTRRPDAQAYYCDTEGLTLKGRGKWRGACCVFHEDRTPSLRVNVETGAFACLGCGIKGGDAIAFYMERHGADFVTAAKALGCWIDDGKPAPTRALPLPPRAALEVLAFEALLAAVAAGNLANGVTLTDEDRARLRLAANRMTVIATEYRA